MSYSIYPYNVVQKKIYLKLNTPITTKETFPEIIDNTVLREQCSIQNF